MKAPHLLTEMNLTFSQYEFERAIYSTLSYGDETAIAELVGKSTSIIAQMYSPDCERESNLYKSARELAAFIQIDPVRGCQALQVFNEFVRRALPVESLCANYEAGQLVKETADVAEKTLNGAPIDIRLKEAREAKQQAERTYEAVFGEWVKGNGNGRR